MVEADLVHREGVDVADVDARIKNVRAWFEVAGPARPCVTNIALQLRVHIASQTPREKANVDVRTHGAGDRGHVEAVNVLWGIGTGKRLHESPHILRHQERAAGVYAGGGVTSTLSFSISTVVAPLMISIR